MFLKMLEHLFFKTMYRKDSAFVLRSISLVAAEAYDL